MGASRVLWSACGQIKDKVKHTIPRRASELEFEFLKREAEYEISPSDARNAWGSEPGSSPLDQGTNDNGHFSYEEFLARFGAGDAEPSGALEELPDNVKPTPMPAGNYTPELSEPSVILDARECSALAAAVPIRHRWRKWHLLYSTGRDGLSLQTLFRSKSRAQHLGGEGQGQPRLRLLLLRGVEGGAALLWNWRELRLSDTAKPVAMAVVPEADGPGTQRFLPVRHSRLPCHRRSTRLRLQIGRGSGVRAVGGE